VQKLVTSIKAKPKKEKAQNKLDIAKGSKQPGSF